MVSGKSVKEELSSEFINIPLGKLITRKSLIIQRKYYLEGNTPECSDCPMCIELGILNEGPCVQENPDDPTEKWCPCGHYYDWDTLKESLLSNGYTDGIFIKKHEGWEDFDNHRILDGNHRAILLKEIYGDDYIVKVGLITPNKGYGE